MGDQKATRWCRRRLCSSKVRLARGLPESRGPRGWANPAPGTRRPALLRDLLRVALDLGLEVVAQERRSKGSNGPTEGEPWKSESSATRSGRRSSSDRWRRSAAPFTGSEGRRPEARVPGWSEAGREGPTGRTVAPNEPQPGNTCSGGPYLSGSRGVLRRGRLDIWLPFSIG